jgi:hypothetical protein
MCMRFIHIKIFRNNKIKYLYKLYNYNKMPITEQEYKEQDMINNFFLEKEGRLEDIHNKNNYYSRLENVSRKFADREKNIKRRFNKIYLQYGRNNLNEFIRSGRNITLRDEDRYLLKDEIHDLVDVLTDNKIKNNDHINIIEQSIIDLKVMYICLMQGLAMSTHEILTNEQVAKGQQQINTRDDNTTELSIISTCDGVKIMRPFVTISRDPGSDAKEEEEIKIPGCQKLTYADRNLALLLDYIKETKDDFRENNSIYDVNSIPRIPKYKSLVLSPDGKSTKVKETVPFENRYEELIRMDLPRRRGGKNKSRGGRKTKKKGTRKKGGLGFTFFKSPEAKFDDALLRYNAAGEQMKPIIKDELDRYANQIEKTNPGKATLYRSSIPKNYGGKPKRRINNKRKTAKKNN